jgi:hypothetical protein
MNALTTADIARCFRPLARLAIGSGWQITRTGGGHLRWRSPRGAVFFSSATPSDNRAVANFAAYLRRAGLKTGTHAKGRLT